MNASHPSRAEGFYDPRTYDWEIGSSAGRAARRAFYVSQVARPGTLVLELGCGTGDISLAIAEEDARVVGIDISPDMIRAARDKARLRGRTSVLWIQAGMEAWAFRQRFTAVIVPYHALFHVLEPQELHELLSRIHACLEPGGVFIADIFTRAPDAKAHRRKTSQTSTPDGLIQVDEDETFDPGTKRQHTRFDYRLAYGPGGPVVDTWVRHLDYLVTEPEALAGQLGFAGFTSVSHFAAFDPARPYTPGDDAVIYGVRSPDR